MVDKFFFQSKEIKKLLKINLIIWVLCAVFLIFKYWDSVFHLALNDTDDLMRYHQYSQWIKQGNWYLQPLPQFNPEDGVIIHWSRIADIPLAIIALLAHFFTDWQTAFTISNTITPLIHLLIFIFVITLLSYKLFGFQTATIAMLLPLPFLSLLSYRFLPGALDHHNIQFILLAFFALCVTTFDVARINLRAFLTACCIVLSLWIGLENIYSFVMVLLILTLFGTVSRPFYLLFSQKVCLYSTILGVFALLLNRPPSEFFIEQYDVISFPFILCFLIGFVFCTTLKFFIRDSVAYKNLIYYVILGLILIVPLIVLYPNLIKGGYADYPVFLKENWLSKISEVKSIMEYITTNSDYFSYIISIIPAILSPLFFAGKRKISHWILYAIFITNLFWALFWQIRMYSTALVCALPLQAYVCWQLRQKTSLIITKIIILFLCFPTFTLVFSKAAIKSIVGQEMIVTENYDNRFNNDFVEVIEFLNKNNIKNKKILTPIDLGVAVIASSDNSIISAPYHRNIRGNTASLKFYLSDNNELAKMILAKYEIDYILVDRDFFSNIINEERKGSMINKLYNKKDIPGYLELLDSNSNMRLYKFNEKHP